METDIKRLIEIGEILESIENDKKFPMNNTPKALKSKLLKEANKIIKKLKGLGFDPDFDEYVYDSDGFEHSLEHSMQFI